MGILSVADPVFNGMVLYLSRGTAQKKEGFLTAVEAYLEKTKKECIEPILKLEDSGQMELALKKVIPGYFDLTMEFGEKIIKMGPVNWALDWLSRFRVFFFLISAPIPKNFRKEFRQSLFSFRNAMNRLNRKIDKTSPDRLVYFDKVVGEDFGFKMITTMFLLTCCLTISPGKVSAESTKLIFERFCSYAKNLSNDVESMLKDWAILADPITMAAIEKHIQYAEKGEEVPGTKSMEEVFKEMGLELGHKV